MFKCLSLLATICYSLTKQSPYFDFIANEKAVAVGAGMISNMFSWFALLAGDVLGSFTSHARNQKLMHFTRTINNVYVCLLIFPTNIVL